MYVGAGRLCPNSLSGSTHPGEHQQTRKPRSVGLDVGIKRSPTTRGARNVLRVNASDINVADGFPAT